MKNNILIKTLTAAVFVLFFMPSVFSQSDWTIKNTSNSPLANNHVRKLYQDQKGDIWVGTRNGLNRIHNNDWQEYTRSNELPHGFITDIVEDNHGNMWIATGKGIAFFNGSTWTHINKKDGIAHNRIFSVAVDSKGKVWLGTNKGASVYDGKNWKTFTHNDGLAHKRVLDIMEDAKGNIWFATAAGVSVYDGTNWNSYKKQDGLGRNFVMSMDQNSNGDIWFGTLNGVFSSYDGLNWEYTKQGSGYYDFRQPLSFLLVGLSTALVLPTAGTGLYLGLMLTAGVILGAAPSYPTLVFIDSEDNIWLSAQPKGVWMFNGNDWMKYTTENGLPHKRVNDIMETSDGELWFGTYKGIAIKGN